MEQINEDLEHSKPNLDEEIDEILRRSMPILPLFKGMDYEIWANKMEDLLCSVNLWCFVQKDFEDPHNRKNAIARFLILSAVDDNVFYSVFYELRQVLSAKAFWDALEMRYSKKRRNINTLQHIGKFEEVFVFEAKEEEEDKKVEELLDKEVEEENIEEIVWAIEHEEEGESHCVDTLVDDEVVGKDAIVASFDDEETLVNPAIDIADDINLVTKFVEFVDDNSVKDKTTHVAVFNEKQYEDFVECLESPFLHKEKMLEASIENKESHAFGTENLCVFADYAGTMKEEHHLDVLTDYDEELRMLEEWIENPRICEDIDKKTVADEESKIIIQESEISIAKIPQEIKLSNIHMQGIELNIEKCLQNIYVWRHNATKNIVNHKDQLNEDTFESNATVNHKDQLNEDTFLSKARGRLQHQIWDPGEHSIFEDEDERNRPKQPNLNPI